jgi:hypothetical protein
MPRLGFSPSRVAPAGWWSRRYLPDSQPPPSGPRQQAQASVQRGGHDLPLDLADQQAVLRLEGDRLGQAERPGHVHGLGELPAGEVGQAVVADLARADEAVEGAQRLLQRRPRVERMDLVQVDGVQPEAAQ